MSDHQIYQRSPSVPHPKGQLLQLAWGGKLWQPVIVRVARRFFRQPQYVPSNNFSEHSHNVYHITYYSEGENSIIVDGKVVRVEAGDLLIIPPGIPHDVMPREKRDIAQLALTFEYRCENELCGCPVDELLALLFGHEFKNPEFVVKLNKQSARELEHILKDMHKSLSENIFDDSHEAEALFKVFQQMGKLLSATMTNAPHVDERLVRVRDYLRKNYIEEPRLDQLARMACLSKGYFVRAFKKAYGVPPLAYRQQLRIDAAVDMLADYSLPLKTIASELGFENVYYFSRIFKQYTGEPPGTFRKKLTLD